MQAPLPFLMTRLAAWLGVALLAVLVLWLLAPVLAPFVIAAVMAYVLHPLVIRLEGVSGGRLPRALAVVLVEALALLSLLGLFLLLVPILVREWPLLQQQLPLLLDRVGDAINPLLAQLGLNVSLDLGELKKQLVTYLSANREDWWAPLMSSLKLGGSVALALAGYAVLVPVALFYMLYDWTRLVNSVLELVPPAWRERFDGFMHDCDEVLGEYLRGQTAGDAGTGRVLRIGPEFVWSGSGAAHRRVHRAGRVCALPGFWPGPGAGAVGGLAAVGALASRDHGGRGLRPGAVA
jgi:predicted PurR-regulated permease PerM